MKKILIMAGGTGGHIMPGLAVADELRSRGWSITWVGNPERMEGRLVPKKGYPLEALRFNGVRGKRLSTLIKLPFTLLSAFLQARRILKKVQPDVVLGMGGYVSFPAGMMAYSKGIPLVIHEQNAVAGTANKTLAKYARRVLSAFPKVLPKAICVGNPVRQDLLDVGDPHARYARRQGALTILVMGGSLGANALNTIVPEALSLLDPEQRPVIIHQSGEQHLERLQQTYEAYGVDATCVDFIDDMQSVLTQADLLICRAGAMTVAEVAAVGVAALFVPLPTAIDDHQTANARYLADQDAAYLCAQSGFTANYLSQWLKLINRDELMEKAVRAHQLSKPNAAKDIADICAELIEDKS